MSGNNYRETATTDDIDKIWQDEKHLSLFLYRAQNLPSLISIYKRYAIDIADPGSMHDACHMDYVMPHPHRGVSVAQW